MRIRKVAAAVGVLVLIAVIGVTVASTVLAQTETPPAEATPAPRLKLWGRGFGSFGGGSTTTFDEVAKALGLTPTQLFEELHSGKTLAEIAEARGVDLEKVQDAITATRTQSMKDAIAQAVEDGKMTQEQADWLLQGLEKGYIPGGRGGFGFMGRGFGHRGHGGMWRFGDGTPDGTPATPEPGTSS